MKDEVATFFPSIPKKIGDSFVAAELFKIVIDPAFVLVLFIKVGIEGFTDAESFAEVSLLADKAQVEKQFFKKALISFGGRKDDEGVIVKLVGPFLRLGKENGGLGKKFFEIGGKIVPPGFGLEKALSKHDS
jgi:hypothetical protein